MIDANSSPAYNSSIAHYVSIDRTRETQCSTTSEGYFSTERLTVSTERMYRTGLFRDNFLVTLDHVISITI